MAEEDRFRVGCALLLQRVIGGGRLSLDEALSAAREQVENDLRYGRDLVRWSRANRRALDLLVTGERAALDSTAHG